MVDEVGSDTAGASRAKEYTIGGQKFRIVTKPLDITNPGISSCLRHQNITRDSLTEDQQVICLEADPSVTPQRASHIRQAVTLNLSIPSNNGRHYETKPIKLEDGSIGYLTGKDSDPHFAQKRKMAITEAVLESAINSIQHGLTDEAALDRAIERSQNHFGRVSSQSSSQGNSR